MSVKVVVMIKLRGKKDLIYTAKEIAEEIRGNLMVTLGVKNDEIVVIEDITKNTDSNEIIIYHLSKTPWVYKTANSIKTTIQIWARREIAKKTKARIVEHPPL